jgi:hypothetical protein
MNTGAIGRDMIRYRLEGERECITFQATTLIRQSAE